jgi:uncharacterized protein YerC
MADKQMKEQYRFWSALIGTPEEFEALKAEGWEVSDVMLTGYTMKRVTQEECPTK